MSWLNLNQSLNTLKGQITNFASEVLSEGPGEDVGDGTAQTNSNVTVLENKCRNQELEISSLKKLVEELEATLQAERISRRNGEKEDESTWYWDPPTQTPNTLESNLEDEYKREIQTLQDEISTLRERDTVDIRPDKDELDRLKEENKNLTNNLEDLDNQHQVAMERLLSLKKELQTNFEVLKQEHEDLKNSNDEYAAEVKKLLSVIEERDRTVEALNTAKSDHDTLYHKYQNLERIHGLLRENAEKFQEENQDLHEEVFKLQEQVTKLEHEIELLTKHAELSNSVPRETYDELLREVNDLKDRRNSSHVHLDEVNIDDNAKSVIENLKREIHDLKQKLNHKESENIDCKTIRPEKVMQLYNKYVTFELPIDYVGEIPSAGDNIVFYKLESVFKTVNSFKNEIDLLEHKMSEKDLNTNNLQTQIDDLTSENDFLTSDIQHLERELNEMRKNNDFLISEIAALKNTSKLEPIIETHEDNLAKLESELADCTKINKSFESEIARINKELLEARNDKITLHESLQDMKHKYKILLEELETLKKQTEAVEEMETHVSNQHVQYLKQRDDEIDDLKKRLAAANSKNEQLSIDLHIIENDKVLLTKQVDELQVALSEESSNRRELEDLKLENDFKIKDLKSKLLAYEHMKAKLDEEVRVFQAELVDKRSVNDFNLLKENDTLKINNSALTDEVETLKEEIVNLKRQEEQLRDQSDSVKNNARYKMEIEALQKKIQEDKVNALLQDPSRKEIESLKEENKKLTVKISQLEIALECTDIKAVRLEEDMENIIIELNAKETLVNDLNATISEHHNHSKSLTAKISDLEKNVKVKNEELSRLKQDFEEVSKKFNDSTVNQEELVRLIRDKEDTEKQLFSLNDEIEHKNAQISSLKLQIQTLENTCNDYKITIDNKDLELERLNQSIIDLTEKQKDSVNIVHKNDEFAKLFQEKGMLEAEIYELKDSISLKEKSIAELNDKLELLQKTAIEYKAIVDNATAEKTDLINLVNLKHNESIQYHNEIQRLNHVILEQNNEFKKTLEEKDKLLMNSSVACTSCENLRITLKEKDDIIMKLNQNVNDSDLIKTELVKANETVINLTEKCDNLDKSLAIQLETVKKLTAENAQLSDKEQNSSRELERLRHHLVETEENYTEEMMAMEQKLTECQSRLHQVEERAKQTSTVYTSNSIRANQEVETLRNQIKLLEKQREDVQLKLSEAEDARSRSEAALTNLQVVLEQFQLDKERDIHAATEKIRNKLEEQKRYNADLQSEISKLNIKLEESLAGLQAASRLGDQVETKTAQINDLKDQVRVLQSSVTAAEERYYNAISNQQDKVDKNLVKNLVINYVITAHSNSTNKNQVLRVLSTVLDFNQQECERLGLSRGPAPDSLAAEFVKFLQDESRPRPTLPSMMNIAGGTSRSTTPASRKSSTAGPPANLPKATHSRNPSTGSNNLLFQNIEAVETASQLSRESDREPKVVSQSLDTGVNQTRNTEGAILKSVLKDM